MLATREGFRFFSGLMVLIVFFFSTELKGQSIIDLGFERTDIRSLWKGYNSEQKSFFPLVRGGYLQAGKVAHFELKASDFPYYYLELDSEDPLSLWINNTLIGFFTQEQFLLDSLASIYGNQLFFSIHADQRIIQKAKTYLVPITQPENLGIISSAAKTRSGLGFQNFLSTGFALILVLLALHRISFPKIFREYFNPAAVFFSRVSMDSLIIARQINPGTLTAIGLYAFMVMFVFLALVNWFPDVPLVFEFFQSDNYGFLMAAFGIGGLAIIGVFIIKFFLVYSLAYLFGFQGFGQIHFFDFIRISSIIYLLMMFWLMLNFFTLPQAIPFGYTLGLTALFVLAGLRVLVIGLKLMNSAKLQFSYLFSYICTTEIIPLAIAIKVFIGA